MRIPTGNCSPLSLLSLFFFFSFSYTAWAGDGLPASCTPGLRIKADLIFRAEMERSYPNPAKKSLINNTHLPFILMVMDGPSSRARRRLLDARRESFEHRSPQQNRKEVIPQPSSETYVFFPNPRATLLQTKPSPFPCVLKH